MENVAKRKRPRRPNAMDQVCVGCTRREAKVHLQAVQSKPELFKKLTTTREADEKDQTKQKNSRWKRSLLEVVMWKVMTKNALGVLRIGKERCGFSSAGGNTVHRRSPNTCGIFLKQLENSLQNVLNLS